MRVITLDILNGFLMNVQICSPSSIRKKIFHTKHNCIIIKNHPLNKKIPRMFVQTKKIKKYLSDTIPSTYTKNTLEEIYDEIFFFVPLLFFLILSNAMLQIITKICLRNRLICLFTWFFPLLCFKKICSCRKRHSRFKSWF